MADSPSHKFGQDLGALLEDIVLNYILKPRLLEYTQNKNLYLDFEEFRPARGGKLVSWSDKYGNSHNLDFVIELGGSATVRGKPLAFIEAAWRRYTKHSKNKAQEIQGALLPIIEQYHAPFCGVVLAGEFTQPSIDQLASNGFVVLYIPYGQVVRAFRTIEIDIAFNERTPDVNYKSANKRLGAITKEDKIKLRKALTKACKPQTDEFMDKLTKMLDRSVKRIVLIPLFGKAHEFLVVQEALVALGELDLRTPAGELMKIEVLIDYSNGDSIKASFSTIEKVGDFLRNFGQAT